jgi:hypothetical protein
VGKPAGWRDLRFFPAASQRSDDLWLAGSVPVMGAAWRQVGKMRWRMGKPAGTRGSLRRVLGALRLRAPPSRRRLPLLLRQVVRCGSTPRTTGYYP